MNTLQRGKPIGWDEVEHLFAEFRSTVFRLETLQRYEAPTEKAAFQNFLAGDIPGSPDLDDWHAELREGIRRGRSYRRVHVVTEPLTDYVRFECAWAYRSNAAAGEDIRILAVEEGRWPEGVPRLDYWLFDSRLMLVMNYSDGGVLESTELVDDPQTVAAAEAWRDRALRLSVPYTEYEARFDAFMRPR
ncbi:hypothetical protein FZ103_12805 [Streptomonospora sp. PA3]|uniref:DUF6879 family protein n=1 Tax=Streptomonospora sp. PA3 TaxID=2607326 RepID=UPI0012DDA8EE|nr:DUF6879 family protein [Streptomonospora sp. PA3]MUL42045.1 hypothetical protein [Streptomonospora sp. PA3]